MVALFCFLQPASPQLVSGNIGQIRLEIENGSPVEHVDATNMQPRSVAPEQFDHREPYRIGTSRRTGCEDSVRTIVGGRRSQQFEAAGTIENPEHNQVRKAFD